LPATVEIRDIPNDLGAEIPATFEDDAAAEQYAVGLFERLVAQTRGLSL
jgi:hypothetical protein